MPAATPPSDNTTTLTDISTWSDALRTAVAAVADACVVCQHVQQRLVSEDTLSKRDSSPVTVADFASQAIVCDHLQRQFPDDGVIGEEDAKELRQPDRQAIRQTIVEEAARVLGDVDEARVLDLIDRGNDAGESGRHWTLDPIDGTKGFLRGEQYAVALALIEQGEVTLGVLGCPNLPASGGVDMQAAKDTGESLGVIMLAERGRGTVAITLDAVSQINQPGELGTPMSVSAITDLAEAKFCESVEARHTSHDDAYQIAEILGVKVDPTRLDSQAKYAAVARGDASIYLRLPTQPSYREKIWDHAAGALCVTEAGGRVTDVAGKPLDFGHGPKLESNRGVIATNGLIHDAVVAAVKQVLGDRVHRD